MYNSALGFTLKAYRVGGDISLVFALTKIGLLETKLDCNNFCQDVEQ
jgi:hypothetical protein